MKKTILLFSFLIICSLSASSQILMEDITELFPAELIKEQGVEKAVYTRRQGQIVEEFSFRADGQISDRLIRNLKKMDSINVHYSYNEQDQLTEVNYTGENNTTSHRRVLVYEKNQLIKEIISQRNTEEHSEYIYDKAGKLIKRISENQTTGDKKTRLYDDQERLINENAHRGKAINNMTIAYTDNQVNIVQKSNNSHSKSKPYEVKLIYNEKGFPVSSEISGASDQSKTIYFYNKKGLIEQLKTGNNIISTFEYVYR